MTAYRRLRVPGATYFFTAALADRSSDLLVRHVEELRRAVAITMSERPFACEAAVVLPDHLHMIWTMPAGDSDFSTRWRLIKSRFSRSTGICRPRGRSQATKQERGVWQRRFWEHCIRGPEDFQLHAHHCWSDPVTHGLVTDPADWPYSSYLRDKRLGRIGEPPKVTPQHGFGEPVPCGKAKGI